MSKSPQPLAFNSVWFVDCKDSLDLLGNYSTTSTNLEEQK